MIDVTRPSTHLISTRRSSSATHSPRDSSRTSPDGEHDRQRLDPVARAAVLERRGARGVGRDDAAGERAGEGRYRRIPARSRRQLGLQRGERHTRADAGVVAIELDAGQLRGGDDESGRGRRASGDRGLRADREDVRRVADQRGDGRFAARPCHRVGVSASNVRGVFHDVPRWCRRHLSNEGRSRRPSEAWRGPDELPRAHDRGIRRTGGADP